MPGVDQVPQTLPIDSASPRQSASTRAPMEAGRDEGLDGEADGGHVDGDAQGGHASRYALPALANTCPLSFFHMQILCGFLCGFRAVEGAHAERGAPSSAQGFAAPPSADRGPLFSVLPAAQVPFACLALRTLASV